MHACIFTGSEIGKVLLFNKNGYLILIKSGSHFVATQALVEIIHNQKI